MFAKYSRAFYGLVQSSTKVLYGRRRQLDQVSKLTYVKVCLDTFHHYKYISSP